MPENNGIDANKVIENLSQQIANKARDVAVLKAQLDDYKEAIDKQQELINAYKEKENAE